jgi:hypothetical protein
MGFCVGLGLIWLRVKTYEAWNDILGGYGVDLATGQGMWVLGWGFWWVRG